VTAVAPGISTITVTAAGSGTGTAATTLTSAATVTVTALPTGITALTVSPASLALATGAKARVVASVQQPTGAAAARLIYGTTEPTIATVDSLGTVTGVAAGSAVITVTATSAANTSFAAATLTQAVAVTVAPPAQVAITSMSRQDGTPLDISNVADQIQVNLAVAPNGQTISAVNLWVCNEGEAVATCAARSGARVAQQTFTASGTQATTIQMFVNTAEFSAPDFTSTSRAGVNTLHKNGLKTLVATLNTAQTTESTVASNSITSINFNNPDGWTVDWTLPANRTNSQGNITWYGGPTVPDTLLPGSQSGRGSFTVMPVIYTPGREIAQVVMQLAWFDGLATNNLCGTNITDRAPPFTFTYGTAARDTVNIVGNCSGNASGSVTAGGVVFSGAAPRVVSAVDNNNNSYPVNALNSQAGRSIFEDFSNIGNSTLGGYRQSAAYRRNYLYQPHDYAAPVIATFDVAGGSSVTLTSSTADSGWVNENYFIAGRDVGASTSTFNLRYRISDAQVGLTSGNGAEAGAPATSRNTRFNVCTRPNPIPTNLTATANTICSAPVASGGIRATVGSMGIPESSTSAGYYVQAVETDRLGNRAISTPFGWTDLNTGATVNPTPQPDYNPITGARNDVTVNAAQSAVVFGVDTTPPVIVAIPNSGAGAIAAAGNSMVRTDRDSIFSTAVSGLTPATQITADDAVFAVRFTDLNGSGFPSCVRPTGDLTVAAHAVGTCPDAASPYTGQANAGTFQVTRRAAPPLAGASNDALVESLIRTDNSSLAVTDRALNRINATISGFDASMREFTFPISGLGTAASGGNFSRIAATSPLTGPAPAITRAGYYTFTGTLTDRAGNSTTIPTRTVAIDNAAPNATGIQMPASLVGGSSVTFNPAGSDDLEAIAGDLRLYYPQLARNDAAGAAVAGQPNNIRFRRVPHFASRGSSTPGATFGLWHNPFEALTDNRVASPVGPGSTLAGSGLTVPIPFIQNIVNVVAATNAPPDTTLLFGRFTTAGDPRPNQVGAFLYDIRSTSVLAYGDGGRSSEVTNAIFAGQVPTPNNAWSTKDWVTTARGAGVTSWQLLTTAGVTEARAVTPSSITSSPFTAVYILRQVGAAEWEYLGTATSLGQNETGGNRTWRWSLSSSAFGQGNGNTMAALTSGEVIKVIGVDASGNGLATQAGTFGLPNALPAGTTITATVAFPATISNGAGPFTTVLEVNPAAPGVSLVAGCSSNSPLIIASMGAANNCTLSAAGVAAANTNVTITLTMTGTAAGSNTNTITQTVTVQRIP
jgi:hypothetical protein